MDLMQKKMKAAGSDSDDATKWQASKEEHVATWHFVMLDKNKNKVIFTLTYLMCIMYMYNMNYDFLLRVVFMCIDCALVTGLGKKRMEKFSNNGGKQ